MKQLVGCEWCKHMEKCDVYVQIRAWGDDLVAKARNMCSKFETASDRKLDARRRELRRV